MALVAYLERLGCWRDLVVACCATCAALFQVVEKVTRDELALHYRWTVGDPQPEQYPSHIRMHMLHAWSSFPMQMASDMTKALEPKEMLPQNQNQVTESQPSCSVWAKQDELILN